MVAREVEVAPERWDRWLAGVAERHGPLTEASPAGGPESHEAAHGNGSVESDARAGKGDGTPENGDASSGDLDDSAGDRGGARARPVVGSSVLPDDIRSRRPVTVWRAADGTLVARLPWSLGLRDAPDQLGVVVLRRGGYAVAIDVAAADGSSPTRLERHKIGSRYVQSRTAAGGWSQQRFARRRANQADALIEAVAEHARRCWSDVSVSGLVLAGDRQLLALLRKEPVLRPWGDLPSVELYDVPDPNRAVLDTVRRRGRAVRVIIDEAPQTALLD